MGEAARDEGDELGVGGRDLGALGGEDLREVLDEGERGLGQAMVGVVKRNETDAVGAARVVIGTDEKRFREHAPFGEVVEGRGKRPRQFGEIDMGVELGRAAQELEKRAVGVQHVEVRADHEAAAGDGAKHIGEKAMARGELVVKPAVFDREAQLFEQVINELKLGVVERPAGYATADERDAERAFAVVDRKRDLTPEDLKFATNFGVLGET